MHHRLYCHLTWTTSGREPAIDRDTATILRRLLPAVALQERGRILEIGIVRTHVHVLLALHPTTAIPRLVQRLKGGSSVLINRERGTTARNALRWAKGYSIDSVSPRSLDRVRTYIRNQPLRHPEDAIPSGGDTSSRVASATDA